MTRFHRRTGRPALSTAETRALSARRLAPQPVGMEDLILAAAEFRGGYAFRSDLLDAGLRDRHIRAAMREGFLERLRHGTYAPRTVTGPLSPEQRHKLIAYSIVDKLGPAVALSHHSAAIAHGCPTWGIDLGVFHLTRVDGRSGRLDASVRYHVGAVVPSEDLTICDGRQVVKPARAVVESCSLSSVEAGMITASFALRNQAVSLPELDELMERHARWPGMLHVRVAVSAAEPRCESVGEVRSMHMFRVAGIPRPEPQFVVTRGDSFVARTDFGWEEFRHVGEFDGEVKYGRLNPNGGGELGQVIVEEKRREDAVRELEYGMSRWGWRDLAPSVREGTAHRIRVAMERSRRLHRRDTRTPLG